MISNIIKPTKTIVAIRPAFRKNSSHLDNFFSMVIIWGGGIIVSVDDVCSVSCTTFVLHLSTILSLQIVSLIILYLTSTMVLSFSLTTETLSVLSARATEGARARGGALAQACAQATATATLHRSTKFCTKALNRETWARFG